MHPIFFFFPYTIRNYTVSNNTNSTPAHLGKTSKRHPRISLESFSRLLLRPPFYRRATIRRLPRVQFHRPRFFFVPRKVGIQFAESNDDGRVPTSRRGRTRRRRRRRRDSSRPYQTEWNSTVVRRMGSRAEADQLCRSIPGREMSRLHLDGILTQPHPPRRRAICSSIIHARESVIADDGAGREIVVIVFEPRPSISPRSDEGMCDVTSGASSIPVLLLS